MAIQSHGTSPNGCLLTLLQNRSQNFAVEKDTVFQKTLYTGPDVIIFPNTTLRLIKCIFLCRVVNFGVLSSEDSWVGCYEDHPSTPSNDWNFSLNARQLKILKTSGITYPLSLFNSFLGWSGPRTFHTGMRFRVLDFSNAYIVEDKQKIDNVFIPSDIIIFPEGYLKFTNSIVCGDVYCLQGGRINGKNSDLPPCRDFDREKIISCLSDDQLHTLSGHYQKGGRLKDCENLAEMRFAENLQLLHAIKQEKAYLTAMAASQIVDLIQSDIVLNTEFSQKVQRFIE